MSAVTATTASSTPAGDAAEFARALEEFFRATRRARARLRPGEESLSISQYHLIEPILDADGPRAAGELATAAGVTPPTATRMLDGLERAGFVERARAEHDRRCVHVVLTDE